MSTSVSQKKQLWNKFILLLIPIVFMYGGWSCPEPKEDVIQKTESYLIKLKELSQSDNCEEAKAQLKEMVDYSGKNDSKYPKSYKIDDKIQRWENRLQDCGSLAKDDNPAAPAKDTASIASVADKPIPSPKIYEKPDPDQPKPRITNITKKPIPVTPKKPVGIAAVSFYETTYNFGTITAGDKIDYIYKFTNTGNAPLIISDAKGSCGCTVPKWPKTPISPGRTGEILVTFDSSNKSGSQSKRITITSNTKPAQTFLTIKGVVNKKESSARICKDLYYRGPEDSKIKINEIAVTPKETVITLELYGLTEEDNVNIYPPGHAEAFHLDISKGKILSTLKAVKDVKTGESMSFTTSSKTFRLFFDPIPVSLDKVHLIEGTGGLDDGQTYWNFRNIDLSCLQ